MRHQDLALISVEHTTIEVDRIPKRILDPQHSYFPRGDGSTRADLVEVDVSIYCRPDAYTTSYGAYMYRLDELSVCGEMREGVIVRRSIAERLGAKPCPDCWHSTMTSVRVSIAVCHTI